MQCNFVMSLVWSPCSLRTWRTQTSHIKELHCTEILAGAWSTHWPKFGSELWCHDYGQSVLSHLGLRCHQTGCRLYKAIWFNTWLATAAWLPHSKCLSSVLSCSEGPNVICCLYKFCTRKMDMYTHICTCSFSASSMHNASETANNKRSQVSALMFCPACILGMFVQLLSYGWAQ